MNRLLKAAIVVSFFTVSVFSQVKDFTTTDLNGKKHTLYTYLDLGKHVVLTFLFDG